MTNAEARFNNSLRPRKPEGSLGWTAQDGHLDSHTAPELCIKKNVQKTNQKKTLDLYRACIVTRRHCGMTGGGASNHRYLL